MFADLNKFVRYIACCAAVAAEMYSASHDDRATIDWCVEVQVTAPPAMKKQLPDTVFIVSLSLAQSASAKPLISLACACLV